MGGPGSGRHGGARDSAGKFTVAGELTEMRQEMRSPS
jgi:hypothetical protein